MIEEYTLRFLDALSPHVAEASPLVYLGVLLGIVNACLFYLFFGRGVLRFLPYVAFGVGGALVGSTVGTQLPEAGPMLGDLHAAATTACSWTILFIARSLRL